MNSYRPYDYAAKAAVLKSITRLIELARAGDTGSANALGIDLEAKLGAFDLDFSNRQLHLLKKIRAQYRLSGATDQVLNMPLPVDSLVKNIKEGVSVVTCCMNRSENLLKALRSWIACSEIDQIVIVDWSSKIPFRDELAASGIQDHRILVARVNDQPRWILSYAFNFGFRIASYDKILKTDADIQIQKDFFRENVLEEKTFLSGDWRIAEKGQEHINGFFYIRRADLFLIKGFNEYITTYGWDDDDIYFRLEQQGLSRVRIKPATVYHIPHDDAQRVGDSAGGLHNSLAHYRQQTGCKIMGNRFIAAAMPMWDAHKFFAPFEITNSSPNYIEAHQSGDSWCQVPPHIKEDADYYGLVTRLSWDYTLEVYSIKKSTLYALLAARNAGEITKLDIRLCVTGGSNAIDWYRNGIVVQFDNSVPWENQRTVVKWLLEAARRNRFTLIAPAGLFSPEELGTTDNGIHSAIELPQGFWATDITQLPPDSLLKLPGILQDSPAFCSTIGEQVATDIVNRFGRGPAEMLEPQSASANRITTNQPKRRLYIDVQHGLGNRLRAFASAACIAQQTDRELIVIWKPDHHCECNFRDLFHYDGKVIAEPPDLDPRGISSYNYMEIEPGSCKDQYISLDAGVDLYVKSAYVLNNELSSWAKENLVLQQLKPVDSVMKLVNAIDINDRVGVHVRMEGAKGLDRNSYDSSENWKEESHRQLNEWRGKSHYNAFMKRIDGLMELEPGLKLFLAADMKEVYPVFVEKYGDKLAYLVREDYDRSARQLRYGLADAILLSRCKLLLGSTWSSFTELAQRLSTTIDRVEMSGTDF